MAKINYRIFQLLVFLTGLATAATAQQQDTALYELQAVEIFGKPAEVYAVGSRISTLDSSYLKTYARLSLAEALQARTPLYLKSYGASGIASVSFRGTSASHTAVLWNGLNISMPSLGQSDFATLPLSGVGSVAVQHGGSSATYGNGAIGGAVLLNSPDYEQQGFRGEVQQEAASFGNYFTNAAASYSGKKVTVGASAFWQMAQNRFPYKDYASVGAPEKTQEHAHVNQQGFTQDLSWQLSAKSWLLFHNWYTSTEREVQPSLGAAYSNARQHDKNLRSMAELRHSSRWGESNVKAAYFSDYLKYTDNSNNSVTAINTYQLQAEQTYAYGARWSLRGGLNLQHFRGDVEGYGGAVEENRAAAFALLRYDPAPALALSLNLRQAFIKGYNPAPTPTVGANWKLLAGNNQQLYLKGNIAGSYRVPTLNDRFWRPGGNPDLTPEQGWNYEGGLRHTYQLGNLSLETEATLYYMLVDNWIQWLPVAAGYWAPRNLQKVRSKGLEFSSRASKAYGLLALGATAGYTFTSSEQAASYEGPEELGLQLAYVPRHKATFFTDATYGSWTLMGNALYNGSVFTNNSNTNSLSAFALFNLSLSKKFTIRQSQLFVTARVDNATDTAYYTMENLPLPGRSYSLNIRFLIP